MTPITIAFFTSTTTTHPTCGSHLALAGEEE